MQKIKSFRYWFKICEKTTIAALLCFCCATAKAADNNTFVDEILDSNSQNNGIWNMENNQLAIDTTVNSGGTLNVNEGATSINTSVNSGGYMNVNNNGTSVNANINNGGNAYVNDGGRVSNTKINDGGSLFVSDSGEAINTTVTTGGSLYIYGSGPIINTTVNGGFIYIYARSYANIDELTIDKDATFDFNTRMSLSNASIYGQNASIINGVADNFILNNDSVLSVYRNEKALNTKVNDKGSLTIYQDGEASNTSINGNGTVEVYDGFVSDTTINDNGKLNIFVDGKATNTTVNSGTITGNRGSTVDGLTVNENGAFNFNTDMTLTNANIYTKEAQIINNVASGFILNNNSSLTVNDSGTVSDTTINDAGTLNVSYGGIASNTVVNGGTINGEYGSIIDGLVVKDKGVFNFSTATTLTNAEVFDKNAFIINGVANNFVLNNGSSLNVYSGNSANNTVVNDGHISIANGATIDGLVVNKDGSFSLDAGASLSNATFYGNNVSIANGVVNGLTLNNESSLSISSGEKAENTTINDAGTLNVYSGGTATNTTVDSGTIRGDSGSIIDGLVIKDKGAFHFDTDTTLTNAKIYGKDASIINGVANNFVLNNGSSLIVYSGSSANNTVVNDGGSISIYDGEANNTTINYGGSANYYNASATNINVASGGTLDVRYNTTVDGLSAGANTTVTIDQNVTMEGDFVFDKETDLSASSYDFSQLFSDTNEGANSLTVVGGVNEVFDNKLLNTNTSQNKSLTFEGGEYSIANVVKEGSTQVVGWDVINIKASDAAPATIVKLESDIELNGSNKNVVIGEKATIDVSGHSPLEITIDGNVTNSGTMDFTIYDNDGEADDIVTIAGDYRAAPGALIVLNVEPEKDKADKMVVQGDVVGTTNLFLKSNSKAKPSSDILFAETENDNETTASDFNIWRVEGSPYKWDSKKEDGKWYTFVDGLADDGTKPIYAPEVIAYMGLYDAGFEQTAGLSRNAINNTVEAKYGKHAWVTPIHQNLEIDAPYKYEAKISGLDAGIDINSDGINKWGVLASYRKGNYEFDGQGDKYYSDKGSEIDIDSYAMGLYFRRDKYNSKFAGTIYAGIQKAEISSDDGAKAKTDALEIGASLDVSHIFEVAKDITITPELQISYQMLDYDNIKDNAGKKVQLEAAHRITAEAGAKLEKKWALNYGIMAIYLKPSLVQTIYGGGKLSAFGLDGIRTIYDRTLGRFEFGGEYRLNTRWSVGASAAYTFGSDYKDTTFGLDAKYRF